jgi:hypothetical protein
MSDNEEQKVIPGDKRVRQICLITLALYVLLLVIIEPVIDLSLSREFTPGGEIADISTLEARKSYISAVAYGAARSLPALFFLWLGYYILRGRRIPPHGMKFPFTVRLIKGRDAMMFGVLVIGAAVMLLYREVVLLLANAMS